MEDEGQLRDPPKAVNDHDDTDDPSTRPGAVVGSYLVALGLLCHAAWDVYHYRANRVVTRSLAEFCLVLDTALAVAIIVLTATA
ncbi:hypothetical protein [Nonomuraea sp. NPDC049158]|uniref:hypothetical protein n=1 Tax=Nonomuraea sp. NPDC049158 TaxID=3155649 RepID=UPI0033E199D5